MVILPASPIPEVLAVILELLVNFSDRVLISILPTSSPELGFTLAPALTSVEIELLLTSSTESAFSTKMFPEVPVPEVNAEICP